MRWPLLLIAALAANALAQNPTLQPQSPAAYRIGRGVSAPSVLHRVEPEYSEEARAANVQGTVTLSLVVDDQGRPQNLKVSRSLELSLDQKAIEAVEQWRFKPGMKEGKAVPVIAAIEVNFQLLHTPAVTSIFMVP